MAPGFDSIEPVASHAPKRRPQMHARSSTFAIMHDCPRRKPLFERLSTCGIPLRSACAPTESRYPSAELKVEVDNRYRAHSTYTYYIWRSRREAEGRTGYLHAGSYLSTCFPAEPKGEDTMRAILVLPQLCSAEQGVEDWNESPDCGRSERRCTYTMGANGRRRQRAGSLHSAHEATDWAHARLPNPTSSPWHVEEGWRAVLSAKLAGA